MSLEDNIKEIYQFFFRKTEVTKEEFESEFGKNFEELLKQGLKYINFLGFDYYRFKNEWGKEVFVIGSIDGLKYSLINIKEEILNVFFIAAYAILKDPSERILEPVLLELFKKYSSQLNKIINKKWLVKKLNYFYISPIGKFILGDYYLKDEKTGKRKIIDAVESIL
ncbi:MAG: hypothetical protein ACTSRZ_05960 [Promethearchaeota archaeon]